jgi:hypothetical protein
LHERELYEHLAKQPARTRLSPKPQATLWPGVPPTDMGRGLAIGSAAKEVYGAEVPGRATGVVALRLVIFPVLAAFEVAVAAAADRPPRTGGSRTHIGTLMARRAREQSGARPVGRPCRHPGELVGLDGAETAAIIGGF